MIFQDETINRIVFHFNKASNKDATIPTWVVKHKGISYYVNHVVSLIGFETKETPDSEHTKGSIQFRGKLKIEKNGETIIATIY
ncbi:MAG TPA: hypothetical protein VFV86_06410 [Nitrososphaeraceae archaeon]|nr:hypothetical protein [Nitrososphaeraceae archaeon]